jgi:hypothetical protein
VVRKDKADVQAGGAKADPVKIPIEAADQLRIAQRLVQRYYEALRDITE